MGKRRCYGCMKMKSENDVCEYCGYDENTQNESHQLAAGTVLNEQYLIGRVLGQGGFGITYMGWDLYLDMPVAIKEYFPSGVVMRDNTVSMDIMSCSGDEGARFQNNKERFMREVKILARFSEVREIVQVKNFFLANNTAYIVMEFVEGSTLKQYVKEQGGKLSVQETFRILRPVMEALCKVHKAGLVHRDISPDNIMMLPDGRAKLLDFGAVRDVGNAQIDKPLTKSTEAILKQGYAPIEQYQNRGSLGPWTDVYAFCATICYCLTGQVPPDAPERLLGEEEISLRGQGVEITEEKEKVLLHGLELRSKDRIPSMEQLCEELFGTEPDHMDELYDPTVKEISEERENAFTKSEELILGMPKKKFGILAGILAVCAVIIIGAGIIGSRKSGGGTDGAASGANISTGNAADSGQCGDEVYWNLSEDKKTLTLSGSGWTYFYVIGPECYGGGEVPDGKIPEEWFKENETPGWYEYRDSIENLVIEEGVTLLGEHLFEGMGSLKNIDFGTVKSIYAWSFAKCTSLTDIELPETVEFVQEDAFVGCENLETVSIPNGTRGVGVRCFYECTNLKSVTFGKNTVLEGDLLREQEEDSVADGVIYYGYTGSAVEENAKEYGVIFQSIGMMENPSGKCGDDITWEFDRETKTLTLSGKGTPYYYTGAYDDPKESKKDTIIAYGVAEKQVFTTYPKWNTYEKYIENLVIEDGIDVLTEALFAGLENLKNIDFGTVETVQCRCFWNCTSLEEVSFPDTVKSVGDAVFSFCSSLKSVEIPNGSKGIEEYVFEGCTELQTVTFGKDTDTGSRDLLETTGDFSEDAAEHVVYYVYDGSSAYENAIINGVAYKIID